MRYGTKTALGSVKITNDDSVIVSLKSSNGQGCLYFESIDQFAEAVKKRHIRVKRWIVSVPQSLCITKTIELPAESLEQAYKMLEFELSTYLPLPAEELVYGCAALGRKENLLKVCVYILKTKTLDTFLARFKSIGITPAKVLVDSVAIENWFNRSRKNSAEIDLLFTTEQMLLLAVKEGRLQRYEQIRLTNGDLEGKREDITEQLEQLTSEFSTDKQPVLKIAAGSDIQEKLKVWFAPDYENIEFPGLPALNSFTKEGSVEKDYTLESVVTCGLLRTAENPELKFLNLLGGKSLNKDQRRMLLINAGVTTLLAVSAICCLWLNFAVANWRIHHACQKITKQIAPIEHIAAEVESKRQKVKAIQTQLANRDQITEIFSQLYKYSPKQIAISQMSYSSKTEAASVNFKGQADTLSRAFEYSDAMKDSELLNNIQIINAQQIPRPGGSIVEFKADCSIKGNKTQWR